MRSQCTLQSAMCTLLRAASYMIQLLNSGYCDKRLRKEPTQVPLLLQLSMNVFAVAGWKPPEDVAQESNKQAEANTNNNINGEEL